MLYRDIITIPDELETFYKNYTKHQQKLRLVNLISEHIEETINTDNYGTTRELQVYVFSPKELKEFIKNKL